MAKAVAERTTDIGGRKATALSNGVVRSVIADKGAMISDFSYPIDNGWTNVHWNPHFRSNSGLPYDPAVHADYWPVELLYELAGNFPCIPNFGAPCNAYGMDFPVHGPTANANWHFVKAGTMEDKTVFAVSELSSADYASIPLSYKKIDIMLPGQPAHYMILKVKNDGSQAYDITAGWHNTVGAPFLETGCIISVCGDRFAVPPKPCEFDDTGHFAQGAVFDDLSKTPLREGGSIDASIVPGMNGFTDIATAAIPLDTDIGWSSLVNPRHGMVYMSWFKGPKVASTDDIILYFNDLWLQYGGRNFTPWANRDGGTDLTYCVGMENATGAYANGLEFSLANRKILGNPTLITVPAGSEMTLSYATMLTPYSDGVLDNGVQRVTGDSGGLIVEGKKGQSQLVNVERDFDKISSIVDSILS